MRLFMNASVVMICGGLAGFTALAQTGPSQAAVMPPTIRAATPGQASGDMLRVSSGGSVETHFAAANTTHDGHLTRAQAEQSSWTRVLKRFDEIDTDHKGWVSVDQIHAYNKAHRKHRKDPAA